MNKGFLNQLERKMGRYAIPHLPMIMLITYAIGYVMELINPQIVYVISLNPHAILHGQIWRIISWVLIPPESSNLFFVLVMLYFYYSIGNTLERTWGTFYFNYYIFSGLAFTILGAFCMYGYAYLFQQDTISGVNKLYEAANGSFSALYGGSYYFAYFSTFFSTYYINMSIFLAFAATYPDMQVLLMFIIPIKVKILGIIYSIILIYQAYELCASYKSPLGLFVIGASLLNFVVFFITTRRGIRLRSPQMRARQREFKRSVREAGAGGRAIAKHKCAICGRSSDDYPDLEFRFCSKCEGNYEYCQDHLFTHKHFVRNQQQ